MKEREKFISEQGREPHIDELAALCGMTPQDASIAIDATANVNSLSASLNGDDEGFTLESTLCEERNEIDAKIEHIALTQAISALPPLWRQIVTLRYLKDFSQQATAKILGITQVKVSREEKKIFATLRKELS